MGGDHAPDEIVRGALLYREKGGTADVVLVGQEERLRPLLAGAHAGIEIQHAAEVIAMDEHPANALRRRSDTSIGVATTLVKKGEADAVVSAGSTGATMAAALLVLGRVRGIDRPALCGMLPVLGERPATCLLDAGATMDATRRTSCSTRAWRPGSCRRCTAVATPSIGLINVGEEPEKGDKVRLEAHALLTGERHELLRQHRRTRRAPWRD
jgi:glycerol-3-phosphate acyltransferase PlsX